MRSLITDSNKCTIPDAINARRTVSERFDAEMQTSKKGLVKLFSDKFRVVELFRGGKACLDDVVTNCALLAC